MAPSSSKRDGPARRETSIRRGIEVLMSLASDEALRSDGLGVTQIAERLGREKSQVSRALTTLGEKRHEHSRSQPVGHVGAQVPSHGCLVDAR